MLLYAIVGIFFQVETAFDDHHTWLVSFLNLPSIQVTPPPSEGGATLTSRRTPFNQQPPFNFEDLVAQLLLAQFLLIILLDKQIRTVSL